MTGPREAQLLSTVDLLLDARRTLVPMDALPAELAPTTLDECYFLQDKLAAVYGKVGGYKIGAPTADATPLFCPMPAAWIAPSGVKLAASTHRFRGLEAEIALLLAHDLEPSDSPYSREEVYAAVASCHPVIEILESGLTDPTLPELRLQQIGDLQMHGGLVYGPAIPDWKSIDFSKEHVSLSVDGGVRVERTGSNTSGDLLRLLPFLANEGDTRTGGLRRGQWVTTGSWTGYTCATANSVVDVRFSTGGHVSVRFE
jgi:2-keto-4-pentenoate hydratase